jgi:hypothetical protein
MDRTADDHHLDDRTADDHHLDDRTADGHHLDDPAGDDHHFDDRTADPAADDHHFDDDHIDDPAAAEPIEGRIGARRLRRSGFGFVDHENEHAGRSPSPLRDGLP